MIRRSLIPFLAAGVFGVGDVTDAAAQIRGSEKAVVAQTIDGTTITLEYSRPVARGRDLFGKVVAWQTVWTPGANWATTLEVDRPIRLGGQEVAAGAYSVWMIPRQGQWTVFLDRNAKLFHFQKPDSTAEQIHVAVTPETGPHTEMLTWSFPAVTGDAGVLRMQWGTTSVPLQVLVEPTKPVAIPAEESALYIGSYDIQTTPGLGWPETGTLEVFESNGALRARLPFPIHPGDEMEFDLVPAGRHRFNAGLYRDGKLFNIEMGASFDFAVDETEGRASGVTLRGIEGSEFAKGQRAGGS